MCDGWSALAKRLHVSRSSIDVYRHKLGAPDRPSYSAWREYLAAHGLAGHAKPKVKDELTAENLRLKNKKLELEISRIEGETLSREEVNEMLLTVASHQRAILYQAMENELPVACDGIPIAESRVKHRDTADKICDEMLRLAGRVQAGIKRSLPAPTLETEEPEQDQGGE
jgi:hypothetical protein